MRVGILTYHDGPNHGAFLQAWATYKTLICAGYKVEVVNYKNINHSKNDGRIRLLKRRNPIAVFRQWNKLRVFRDAQKGFKLGAFMSDPTLLKKDRYDCIVIGSDVVWNYKIFGYDPVYFGDVNAKRIISFSASFGSVLHDDEHPGRMCADLKSFDGISVRDQNTKRIVKEVSGRNAALTLDPTLIYDFDDETEGSVCNVPYMVVYSYRQSEAIVKKINSYSKSNGLKSFCLGYPPAFGSSRFYNRVNMSVGPFDWIKYYRGASVIWTSTYHGVIFSLKYRKPFFYVSNDSAHNRVESLLNMAGIEHNLEVGKEDLITYFDPDYDAVWSNLESYIETTKNWLLASVKGLIA
jgi:hypothetical protein